MGTFNMIIYKITNLINNKIYIGQTVQSLNDRWCGHKTASSNTIISNAIKKYGPDNFTIEEIDGANSLSELNYLEQHYIWIYDCLSPNGYNIKFGGNNKNLTDEIKDKIRNKATGRKHTADTRKKIGDFQRGKKKLTPRWNEGKHLSDQHKENISKANTGRKLNEEWCSNISKGNKNKPKSKEHREKLRQAKLGRKLSEDHKKALSLGQRRRHEQTKKK